MARMGGAGMRAVAEVSAQRAHHLAARLTELPGVSLAHQEAPFLWEFALRITGDVEQLVAALRRRGILAGLALDRFDEGPAPPAQTDDRGVDHRPAGCN